VYTKDLIYAKFHVSIHFQNGSTLVSYLRQRQLLPQIFLALYERYIVTGLLDPASIRQSAVTQEITFSGRLLALSVAVGAPARKHDHCHRRRRGPRRRRVPALRQRPAHHFRRSYYYYHPG
jgi:hypothetical protein